MANSIHQLSAYVESFGSYAILCAVLAVIVQTFIPYAPYILIAGANVLVFGLFKGFIINYLSACLGAWLVFVFARYIGYDWVEKKLSNYQLTRKFTRKMQDHGFYYVLFGRLIYIFPSSIINLGAGVTKISMRSYVTATMLGKFPIILMESVLVHDLAHLHEYLARLLLLSAAFVVLLTAGNQIRKKYSTKDERRNNFH